MTPEQVRDYHLSEVSRFNRTQNQFPHDSTVLTAFAKHHKDMADAIIRHLPQPTKLEDAVLVPREPTPKMVDATWDHEIDRNGGIESQVARNKRIYKAMLTAALQENAK